MDHTSARPRYLHPYNYYEQQQQQYQNQTHEKPWSNNHYATYCGSQSYEPPPLSPLGLREVLSSYTPGPTVIMMEKKRRPGYFDNTNVRLACILIIGLLGCYIIRSSLHSSDAEKPFFELKSPSPALKTNPNTAETTEEQEPVKSFATEGQYKNLDDNLSGYTYLNNNHFKYASVIMSLDDDDESFVEDIVNYTFL